MEEKITNVIKEVIENAGYILADVVYEKENQNSFLRIFIDKKDDYINISDCVKVNKLVDPLLDELTFINESYIVDICSSKKGSE